MHRNHSIALLWRFTWFAGILSQFLQLGKLPDKTEDILRASQEHRSLTGSSSPSWYSAIFTERNRAKYATHAILVPYRNRSLHLERFREYMTPYLRDNFSRDNFTIWVVEQGDDTLFNKGWVANVGLSEIRKAIPDVECVIFHDVDLLPDTPSVPYNQCDRPIQLGSELSHFNWTVPYLFSAGAVVSMRMDHWRSINGMSNEYIGWGGEDDDIHERLRLNRLLNMSGTPRPHIFRPPIGRGRFVTVNESSEHHARKVGKDTVFFLYNTELLRLMQEDSDRWEHDGLSNVHYEIVERKMDYTNGFRHLKALPSSEGWRTLHTLTKRDLRIAHKSAGENATFDFEDPRYKQLLAFSRLEVTTKSKALGKLPGQARHKPKTSNRTSPATTEKRKKFLLPPSKFVKSRAIDPSLTSAKKQ